MGAAYEALGQQDEARRHYEFSLVLSRRLEYPSGQNDALNGLGRLHLTAGRVDWSIRCHRDALDLSEEIGSRPFIIEVRNDLGVALRRAGRLYEALGHHQAALSDAGALDDRFELARAYAGVAAVNLSRAAFRVAAEHWRRAFALFTDLCSPEAGVVAAALETLNGGRALG